jgi:DNA-nicking Smr family endonuclease
VSKKKERSKSNKSEEPELPKFGGFHPLEGLRAFKEKLKQEEEEKAAKAKENKRPPPPPRPAPSAPIAKRTAETDREDELSFHRLMAGVTPLDAKSAHARVPLTGGDPGDAGDARGRPRPRPAELRAKAQVEAAAVLDHLRDLVDDKTRFEITDDGQHVQGRRADVSPTVLRDLRQGRLPIDARIDLGSSPREEAQARLSEFLREKRSRGERCVLVIHGRTDANPNGLLRGEVAAWLAQSSARDHVAAFASANIPDTADAMYVALRK